MKKELIIEEVSKQKSRSFREFFYVYRKLTIFYYNRYLFLVKSYPMEIFSLIFPFLFWPIIQSLIFFSVNLLPFFLKELLEEFIHKSKSNFDHFFVKFLVFYQLSGFDLKKGVIFRNIAFSAIAASNASKSIPGPDFVFLFYKLLPDLAFISSFLLKLDNKFLINNSNSNLNHKEEKDLILLNLKNVRKSDIFYFEVISYLAITFFFSFLIFLSRFAFPALKITTNIKYFSFQLLINYLFHFWISRVIITFSVLNQSYSELLVTLISILAFFKELNEIKNFYLDILLYLLNASIIAFFVRKNFSNYRKANEDN